MITNLSIGHAGRLGNQMFQYAMLLGIKHKLGYEVMLNEEINGSIQLTKCFHLKQCHFYNRKDISVTHLYEEPVFNFDRRFFKKIEDSTDFRGYFQTEKYFDHCKDIIRSEFTFKPHIVNNAKERLNGVSDKHLVSIHVRRGDYVNLPNHHPLCTVDYYNNAIELFDKEVTFVVISDDIPWCKEYLIFNNAIFIEDSFDVDMCVMSMCNDHIIANSTFSWWGSWLNPSTTKRIVAPKTWFGPAYAHYNTSDLYTNGWTVL